MRFSSSAFRKMASSFIAALFALSSIACDGGTELPEAPKEDEVSIRLITPARGIPGDTVVINGVNFTTDATVKFGDLIATVLEVNKYRISVLVPEGVASNASLTVHQKGMSSNALMFHFQEMEKMELADPTVFLYNGTYYVYGTAGRGGDVNRGFMVYSSSDLRKWDGPKGADQGFALVKEKTFGDSGFWAPQVVEYKGLLYMIYTANENLAIAKSQSPLGPFVQHAVLTGPTKQIDPFLFFDDDGKIYLYYVKLSGGNKIFVAEMEEDLTAIKEETSLLCIEASEGWEVTNRWVLVAEGPTVLKQEGKYYLFYSANHFESPDYAMGYAVSDSPTGPWEKYNRNPILSRELLGMHGTGHGDFFRDKNGKYRYVFHSHFDNSKVQPRLTAIINGEFISGGAGNPFAMSLQKETFKYLLINN